MSATMRVEVVSSEKLIYSGEASFLVAPAEGGEIGVYPRHIPLLARIKPGLLRLSVPDHTEQVLVALSGGLMEIQPTVVTILADTAIRAEDLDEGKAEMAKHAAEQDLKKATDDTSTAKAHAALAAAIAELKTLEYLKKRRH